MSIPAGTFHRSTKTMNPESQTFAPVYDSEDEYRPAPEPEPQAPPWMDGSLRIGIHTSIAGGLTEALESARKLGCNALQIFSASPRMWHGAGSHIGEADAERFRTRRMELVLGPLAIHANYLINLAASNPMMRARSIQAFRGEIVRALALGADFLVVHPGSALGQSSQQAVALVADSLRQAARGVRFESARAREKHAGSLRILIENTSGMGSAMGTRFEELRAILDSAPELPLGICLDTAHAFEAGYDIRSAEGLERTLAEFDRIVGLDRLFVLHANDSKTAFGSRVDRHQHIGRGMIGAEAFARMLAHPRLSSRAPSGLPGRAFLLETPIDEPGDDRRNVRALWELAGAAPKQAPEAEDGFTMRREPKKAAVRKGASKKPVMKQRVKVASKAKSPKQKPKDRR